MLYSLKLEAMVLCMKQKISLLVKQINDKRKDADIQTVRLFAILAGLTLLFVVIIRAVQFLPGAPVMPEIKPVNEAKISP